MKKNHPVEMTFAFIVCFLCLCFCSVFGTIAIPVKNKGKGESVKYCLEEIEFRIQGQMVKMARQSARGKASTLTSVKQLDVASGTMDRWRLMKMKIFWNKFSYFSSVVLVSSWKRAMWKWT